jgi:hypothetical protein
MRDFRLLPWYRWDLRSSGILCSVWVVVLYRRFGTTYRSHLEGTGIVGQEEKFFPWTRNYHSTLRNIPDERRSQTLVFSTEIHHNSTTRCRHGRCRRHSY